MKIRIPRFVKRVLMVVLTLCLLLSMLPLAALAAEDELELIAEFKDTKTGIQLLTFLQGLNDDYYNPGIVEADIFVNTGIPQPDTGLNPDGVTSAIYVNSGGGTLGTYIDRDTYEANMGEQANYRAAGSPAIESLPAVPEVPAYRLLEQYLNNRGNSAAFGASVTIGIYQWSESERFEIRIIEQYLAQYIGKTEDDPGTPLINEAEVHFNLFNSTPPTAVTAKPYDENDNPNGLTNFEDIFDYGGIGDYYIATARGIISPNAGIMPLVGSNSVLREVYLPARTIIGVASASSPTIMTIGGTVYDRALVAPSIYVLDFTNTYAFYLDADDVIIGASYIPPSLPNMGGFLYLLAAEGSAASSPLKDDAWAKAMVILGTGSEVIVDLLINESNQFWNPAQGASIIGGYSDLPPDPCGTLMGIDGLVTGFYAYMIQANGSYRLTKLPEGLVALNGRASSPESPYIEKGKQNIGDYGAGNTAVSATNRTILTIIDRNGVGVFTGVDNFPVTPLGFDGGNGHALVRFEPGGNNLAAEILYINTGSTEINPPVMYAYLLEDSGLDIQGRYYSATFAGDDGHWHEDMIINNYYDAQGNHVVDPNSTRFYKLELANIINEWTQMDEWTATPLFGSYIPDECVFAGYTNGVAASAEFELAAHEGGWGAITPFPYRPSGMNIVGVPWDTSMIPLEDLGMNEDIANVDPNRLIVIALEDGVAMVAFVMKNFIGVGQVAGLTGTGVTDIVITPSFTDPNFLAAVREAIGKPNGPILASDVAGITALDVSNRGITSLSGIEWFTALQELNCINNQLTFLDVSNNTALEVLSCINNQLSILDISNNPALKNLDCRYNYMNTPDGVIGWLSNSSLVLDSTFLFFPQSTRIFAEHTNTVADSVINIPVKIENNPGIAGFKFEFTWGSSLELISIENGDVLSDGIFEDNISGGSLTWVNKTNITGDGVLFTLCFNVRGDAEPGVYSISTQLADGLSMSFVNEYSQPVSAVFEDFIVNVVSYTLGDIDSDGNITVNDAVLLVRYLAGLISFDPVQLRAADVNKDGDITSADAVRLIRFIAGLISSLDYSGYMPSPAQASAPFVGAMGSSDESVQIVVDKVTIAEGQTSVIVPVRIIGNPGFAGITLDIDYAEGLTLTSIAKGPVVTSGAFEANPQNNRFSWVNPTNVTSDGVLIMLTFTVGDFSDGTKSVSVKLTNDLPTNFCDESESPIAVDFVPGGVVIQEPGGGGDGITITGQVQSYNPNNPVTIKLMQGDEVKYTTTIIDETSGSGRIEQEFTFTGVAPGMYTLVITKDMHLDFTVENIVVNDDDIDFTLDKRKEVKTLSLVAGDVGDENCVDFGSMSAVLNNLYKTATQAENDEGVSLDVNGDGLVDAFDVYIILNNMNKTNDPIIW